MVVLMAGFGISAVADFMKFISVSDHITNLSIYEKISKSKSV